MKGIKTRIHWNRIEKRWTAKTSKGCPRYPFILVKGGWVTEVKPHLKTNPKGFVLTTDQNVHFINEVTASEIFESRNSKKLIYDKVEMNFNYNEGEEILFTPTGAFVLF